MFTSRPGYMLATLAFPVWIYGLFLEHYVEYFTEFRKAAGKVLAYVNIDPSTWLLWGLLRNAELNA